MYIIVMSALGELAIPSAICGLTTSFIAKRWMGMPAKWLYLKHFFALWLGGILSAGLLGASWGHLLFVLYLVSPLLLALKPFIKPQRASLLKEPSISRSRNIQPSLLTVARALDQTDTPPPSPFPSAASSPGTTPTEERVSAPSWSKSVVGAFALIVIVIGGAAAKVAVRAVHDRNGSSAIDQALIETSRQMNAMAPVHVDSSTRLDSTVAGPGKRLTHLYTVVDLTAGSVDSAALSAALKAQLVNTYKTFPAFAIFRANNVEMQYHYRDKNGRHLTTVVVSPRDF